VCATADGSHHLKPVIIGESAKPLPLRHVINDLPVIYMSNRQHKNCLLASFKPILYLRSRNTGCMNLNMNLKARKPYYYWATLPGRPSTDLLKSKNGKIKCMFLPPNASSLLQDMNQGVILTCKRFFYSHSGGWSSYWVHLARRPLNCLLYLPWLIVMMENLVEWGLAGETEVPWENLPQRHFDHHKSHLTRLGFQPGPPRWEANN
jgi:hypothetical protein